jgi:hypothetical protein
LNVSGKGSYGERSTVGDIPDPAVQPAPSPTNGLAGALGDAYELLLEQTFEEVFYSTMPGTLHIESGAQVLAV